MAQNESLGNAGTFLHSVHSILQGQCSGTMLSLSLKTSSHRTDLFAGQKGSFPHSVKVGLKRMDQKGNHLQSKVTQISLLKTINH